MLKSCILNYVYNNYDLQLLQLPRMILVFVRVIFVWKLKYPGMNMSMLPDTHTLVKTEFSKRTTSTRNHSPILWYFSKKKWD